jgi:hypothetical protein
MPSLLLYLNIKEFTLNILQALHNQLHNFFMPNECCGQRFFITNYYILHLLHDLGEFAIHNCKVQLYNLQSLPCLLLLLSLFQLLLNFMEFFYLNVFQQTQALN